MPYYFFQWNDNIVDYLAQHDVTPEEFEYVVQHPLRTEISKSTGRELAFGCTPSGDFIACLYDWLDKDTVIPVTAYRPSQGE